MTIKKREAELFRRWRQERGYDPFISDGVFAEKVWKEQKPKITFLMKDPHWDAKESGDICENLRNFPQGSHWRTWNNVARWTKSLLESGEYPRYLSWEERLHWLQKVSCMNLKKAAGGPKTDIKALWKCAHDDAEWIREQLLLYEPDIIICCGKSTTARFFQEKVLQRDDLKNGPWPVQDWETSDGISWFHTRLPGRERLTPVASFYHPAYGRSHARWKTWYDQMREIGQLLLPPGERDGQTSLSAPGEKAAGSAF